LADVACDFCDQDRHYQRGEVPVPPLSGKGLCCSFADGQTVADPDWESKDGHYRVRIDNNWIDVPDDALITEPNRLGRTMVLADVVQR